MMTKILRLYMVAIGLLVMLLAFSGAGQAGSGMWSIVPSQNPAGDDTLFGVAAISPNDVWEVGASNEANQALTLAEHWNGSSWSVVSSPNPGLGPYGNKLLGVTAVSTSNVWAVGYAYNSPLRTLVEHWNGTQWSVVPSPFPGSLDNRLVSVSAASANDIWAVGDYTMSSNSNASLTLTEHWNGSQWSVVPSPNPGTTSSYNNLHSVVAVSATNAWAVGNYTNSQGVPQTLILHWNGTRWHVVTSPNPGSAGNFLFGVSAVSATNIWAVGESYTGTLTKTLTENWNGTAWSVVPSPTPTIGAFLNGVSVASATDIWAVGQAGFASGLSANGATSTSSPTTKTLILHWNGTSWSKVTSPNPAGSFVNTLYAVAHVPSSSQVWAVGGYANSSPPAQTLTEFSR